MSFLCTACICCMSPRLQAVEAAEVNFQMEQLIKTVGTPDVVINKSKRSMTLMTKSRALTLAYDANGELTSLLLLVRKDGAVTIFSDLNVDGIWDSRQIELAGEKSESENIKGEWKQVQILNGQRTVEINGVPHLLKSFDGKVGAWRLVEMGGARDRLP